MAEQPATMRLVHTEPERVPLRVARAKLSGLVTRAEGGERIIITRDGKDAVLLSPAPARAVDGSTARPPASREAAQAKQRSVDGILNRVNRGRGSAAST